MKYYAVRSGRNRGVYESWTACREQVHGYSGAVYRSFESREDAEIYLASGPPEREPDQGIPFAYIDGSFSKKNGVYGWGGYISCSGEIRIIQGTGNAKDYMKYRNISGEIRGVLEVIRQAISMGLPEISIYYDYAGIGNWANASWKCNNELSRFYQRYYLNSRTRLKVHFIHVRGHRGVVGNELADLLAREAVGAALTKKETARLRDFKQGRNEPWK